ncbi:MAG: type II secretion system F family protein [Candidatus Sericytochromatia bacterium]|nr:type II secretion system F family protein [Candidatus Sericytochromatia bacterium]
MDPRLLFVFLLAFLSAGLLAVVVARRYEARLGRWLEGYLARTRKALARTRNPLSTERFARQQAGLVGLCGLLGFVLGEGLASRVFLALLAAGVVWSLSNRWLDVQWQRYVKEFEEQLPDAVGVLANAVRSGFSVQQALDLVTQEFADPMGAEVREVMQELTMGVPFDQAVQSWSDRMNHDDLDIVCTALVIQRQTGGNLGEILDNLAGTMRERRRIQGQIRTLTTQGRFSGSILSFLPVGLYFILLLIAPDRMGVLFTEPLGWALVLICVVMVTTGSLVVRKIVALDV